MNIIDQFITDICILGGQITQFWDSPFPKIIVSYSIPIIVSIFILYQLHRKFTPVGVCLSMTVGFINAWVAAEIAPLFVDPVSWLLFLICNIVLCISIIYICDYVDRKLRSLWSKRTWKS